MANNSPIRIGRNGIYYVSGQLPADLTASLPEQTASSLEKINSLLAEHGLAKESILKMTLYVTDMTKMPEINEVYGAFFEGMELPARSAFQVGALGQGAKIEIDCYGEA